MVTLRLCDSPLVLLRRAVRYGPSPTFLKLASMLNGPEERKEKINHLRKRSSALLRPRTGQRRWLSRDYQRCLVRRVSSVQGKPRAGSSISTDKVRHHPIQFWRHSINRPIVQDWCRILPSGTLRIQRNHVPQNARISLTAMWTISVKLLLELAGD